MKNLVFAVRDSAVDAFLPTFMMPSVGAAVRGFSDAVNNKESEFYKHPEDYELFLLAEFDNESGLFENVERRSLARGKEMISS